MSLYWKFSLILCGLVGAAAMTVGASYQWKVFESRTQHFRVSYPASWNLLEGVGGAVYADRLDIINFPNSERAEGVVLKKGGAEISVSGPPSGVRTVQAWIHTFNDTLIEHGDVPVSAPSPGGCRKLQRVISRDEIGPGTYFVNTAYYCSTDDRFFQIQLVNWQGDPHERQLQRIALQVALSLRSR